MLKALGFAAFMVIALVLVVGYVLLLGWAVTVVVSWFGVTLALWQGCAVAFLVNALIGGSSR